jgi:Fe-S cluster biogenesis protein NfuA
MEEKIRAKLEDLRKMLQADGGDLEVVSIDGTSVNLRLRGACGSCPHAAMTLKQGIERVLRDEIDPAILVTRVA